MDIAFRPVDPHDPNDLGETRSLVFDAFGDEGEETATFLDTLRADGCILGEWCGKDAIGTVGHIVLSRVWLEKGDGSRQPCAMLTPLAVRRDRQRQRIGLRLMKHALQALECRGESVFFVIGHPEYYPQAGFHAASTAGIESPWPGEPFFMARSRDMQRGRLVMPRVIADAH